MITAAALDGWSLFDVLGGRVEWPEDDPRVDGLATAIGDLCRDHVDNLAVDRDMRLPADVVRRAAALGLFGLTFPREAGGCELTISSFASLMMRTAHHCGSFAAMIGAHNGLAAYALLHHAAAALRAHVLPEIARGESVLAYATTEPGAGSDVGSLSTTAVAGHGRLTLTGGKCFITNGGTARYATVLARTPGLGRGPFSLLFVDLASPGVTRSAEENKLGLRGVSNVRLAFDRVRVPLDHVLGAPGQGGDVSLRALQVGRTVLAAACVGAARGAIAMARRHTAERVQFGKPLAEQPLVRRHLALAEARTLAAEAAVRVAAAECDRGVRSLWPAVAKIGCSETAWEVVDTMLGLHGGLGFMETAGIARYLRDVRVTRIFEGANDVLRLALSGQLVLDEGLRSGDMPAADRAAGAFTVALRRMCSTYRVGLLQRPSDCARLADAFVASAMAAASAARHRDGADARARLFAEYAAGRVDVIVRALESPSDALADAVT